MSDRVITAHVPLALANEVDELARVIDRTRGWIMKEALSQYVELEKRRHALTVEALEAVDAGRTIDHREVEAWAAALPGRPRSKKR